MPAQRGPATSRRTALAGAAAGLLASSCDAGGSDRDPAPAVTTAPPDPDALLAGHAAALSAERLALAGTLADRYPALAPRMRAFVALHRAHAGVLPAPDVEGVPPAVPDGARVEMGRFRLGEARAARRLAGWAVAAESGALARLLASMSAGIAAHLAADDRSGVPR